MTEGIHDRIPVSGLIADAEISDQQGVSKTVLASGFVFRRVRSRGTMNEFRQFGVLRDLRKIRGNPLRNHIALRLKSQIAVIIHRISLKNDSELTQIVFAFHPSCRAPGLLQSGKKHPRQNCDNRNRYKELYEGKFV